LLIYDPDEKWPQRRDRQPTRNDGGQRMPNNRREAPTLDVLLSEGYKTGEVEGHWMGPDPHVPSVTYLKGDITEAYSEKVKEVKRSFAFINFHNADVPAALVVFDRVVSADPGYRKYWLLHCMEEPEVEGNRFTISRTAPGERGKLVNTALLPDVDNLEMEAIGGPGKEFWVFGENYQNSPRGDREGSHELGAWRMQLSPKAPSDLDCFLSVTQVMDRDSGSPHPVRLVEDEAVVGVQFADRAVLFSRSGQRLDEPISLELSGEGALKILVADLAEGTWQVWRDGEIVAPAVEVTADAGILYLEGPGGSYALRR
ncbi:MAG: heparinase, partial [Candidatus Latescibacteria bacterium]|nr:heparinase [Candidatus Latescibacterota bacterium]